jgi:hypothetical protein
MSDWIDFSHWPDCATLSRPGYVFEVANAQDQRLLTPCAPELEVPWDWKSGPVRFRLVIEEKPVHSTPIPPPAT